MNPSWRPPGSGGGGGPIRSPHQRAALNERVKQQLSHYTNAGDGEEVYYDDSEILADDYRKPTIRIILGVFAASLFAYFAAAPTFDAPNIWANTFRFDTAFVVVWGPLLYWSMARFKLQKSLRIFLVLSLFIEPFSEAMLKLQGEGYWDTYLWPAAVAYYGTIKEWSGLPGASLPVFFFLTAGLLYRAVWGKKHESYVAPPRFAKQVLFGFLGTVVVLSAWGLIHGGTLEGIVRQVLHMVQLPLIAFLFLYALRVPEDLAAIGTIFVITAMLRSVFCIYIYFFVFMPMGITDRPGLPEWCTTHSDTVLFVVSILIVVTHAFEQRTRKTIYSAIGCSALIMFAIILNNRRLAFVSLSIAPAVIYFALKPSRRKRRVTAALILAVPLMIGYVLIGSEINSPSQLLKPAKLVMSVLDQKDLSAQSRDIENENLIYTLRQSPFVTSGFGSEYQYSPDNPPVDLTDVFVNYRLIAHNGVLWLWSLGGVVGFTMLWLIFPISGTLALRGYRAANTPLERSAALTALGSVAICIVQIWGDQGINGYMTPIVVGVSFAVATRLATKST